MKNVVDFYRKIIKSFSFLFDVEKKSFFNGKHAKPYVIYTIKVKTKKFHKKERPNGN